MKRNNLYLLFFLLIGDTQFQIASNTATSNAIKKTTSSADPAQDDLKQQQDQAAALAFPADMPTTSINEKIIDQIYGAQGLNIPSNDLANIKKCYCYLEFLTKIDKIKNDTSLAQYQDDFKDFLQPNADNSPLRPTAALVTSKGWQGVKITGQDIIKSQAWQLCNKTTICDTLTNDADFIINAGQTNNQLSQYIPNIEQAYADNTFTQLRLYEDVIQLQALIQSQQRQKYLAQCTDWQNISPSKINDAIALFQKTDFYTYTHNSQPTQQAKDPKTGAVIPTIIPSPLREQIICYFMLMHIQMTINDLIMQKNSAAVMTQVSSSQLVPNFMAYDASDFIYINDLIATQALIDQNKANPKKSLLTMQMPADTATSSASSGQNASTGAAANNVTIQAVATQPAASTPTDPKQLLTSTLAQLPTTSTYEAMIDQIYGKSGLNIAVDQLANIKKTYCYLEYLVKVEKVRSNATYAQYQKTDFKNYAQPGMTKLIMPTQDLVSSDGWKKIPVTQDEIVASPGWQNFIKSMVCDIYDQQQTFIIDMAEANQQLFVYCPNIESAYATNDFTSMRLYAESIQLNAAMQNDQKQRYLQQCIDWKAIDSAKMDTQIAAFKKTDYYALTHPAATPQAQQPAAAFATGEQAMGFALLTSIQQTIYTSLTTSNLMQFLQQAGSTKIAPNFFGYISTDYICLYDFITLSTLIAQNKANPAAYTITMRTAADLETSDVAVQSMHNTQSDDDDEIEEEVVIQKINIGKAITKVAKSAVSKSTWDPNKNGVAASVAKTNKASAKALAPLDPAKNGFNKAMGKMVEALHTVDTYIATGLIEATTALIFASCSFIAAFPGSGVDADKVTAHCKATLNRYKGAIVAILDTNAIMLTFFMGNFMAPMLIYGMVTDTKIKKDTTAGMMKAMVPMMLIMDPITDAFTTGLIEIAVGYTWFYCSIGHLFNPKINVQAEMNKVRAKMEKNRSSINIAMSIVVTIVITLVIIACTMGAGMLYASALDAGYFGAAAAARSAAAAAATAAEASTAANIAAAAAQEALGAAVLGGDAATIATAEAYSEWAIIVSQSAKEVAAQSALKATARETAVTLTAQVTEKQAAETSAQLILKNATDPVVIAAAQDNLVAATAARQAAEVAAKEAVQEAAAESAKLTVLQAQLAANQAAARSAFAATQPSMLESMATSAGKMATTVGKSITSLVYGSATEDATLTAASVAANDAVTAANAAETAAQAALDATQVGSKEAAAATLRLQAATAAKQAAIKTAQQAAEVASQSGLKVTAQESLNTATKNLAEMQAKEVLAKQAADKVALGVTESSSESAQVAAEEALGKSTQATLNRKAAELAVQKSTQELAQQTENLANLQMQQAAEQIAAKQAAAASYQASNATIIVTKNSSQQAVDTITAKQAAQQTEQQAAKLVVEQTAAETKAAAQTAQAELKQASETLAAKQAAQKTAETGVQNATTNLATKQAAQQAAEQELQVAQQQATRLAQLAQEEGSELSELAAKRAALEVTEKETGVNTAKQATIKATAELSEAQVDANVAKQIVTQAQIEVGESQAALDAADGAANKAAVKLTIQQNADATTERASAEAAKKLAAQQADSDAGRAAADLAAKKATVEESKTIVAQKIENETAAVTQAQSTQASATTTQNASKEAAAQLAAKQTEKETAEQLLTQSTSDLAKKQAAQQVAEHDLQVAQAATKAAQEAVAESTDDPALLLAARQAADDEAEKEIIANTAKKAVTQATQDQQAAETQVQSLTKETQNLAGESAVKRQLANTAKTTAESASKTQMEATAARQTAETSAARAQQNLLKTSQEIMAANNARIAGLSLGQEAVENGFLKTLGEKTIFNVGFIIGQVLNAGFGVFGILGAIAQDEAAADALEAERLSIQSLWSFVEDNKVNLTQNQSCYLDELHKKHQVAVENQAFGLQYYSNFLNSSVNMVQNQIAQALAQQYIQMLTPDSNGLRVADIGSTWGLQTQFDYLYPSQGFITTTLGRPDFPYAQEVAQAPLASETHGSNSTDLSDNQTAATKLWFNQRAVSVINQSADKPLNVEIKFRVLYNLNTAYHVGLYLGGNYHDYNSADYLQSIQDQGSIDLDEANLAKMLVLKRDDGQSAPSIGLYEHEGLGWLAQEAADANILNSASVYHMSAKLQKDALTVSFWSEDNASAKWTKTTKVTPCDQRTFGVIFSGIAIEWDVVQPTSSITQNKTARVASNGQAEADREKASKDQWKQLLNPKFGSMTLQSSGRPALLQGQYLYTTQSTGLVDGQGTPITDYVVFATASGSNVTALGASPAQNAPAGTSPNALVSLITGNVYNSAGKIITHTENALNTYAQKSTSISQSLGDAIAQAGKAYQQKLLNISFGSYKLTAVSADVINAGLFIYTCPTTITNKDAYGKPILDYLIMADLVNNSLGSTIGMPPSSSVPGMVSLVTGNVYARTSITPVDGGYAEITQYTKRYGQLPQTVASAISSATNTYNNALGAQAQAAQATKTAQVNVIASQTFSFTDLMNALPPTTGGTQIGLSSSAPSNIVATQSSISQLQSSAAGTATIEFGGMGAIGLAFGDATSTQIYAPVTYSQPAAGYTMPTTQPAQNQTTDATTQQSTFVNQTQTTNSSAQSSPIISANMTYEFGDMGPVGLGFGDNTTLYQAPVTYVQPSQTTSYNIPQTSAQPTQNQSTNTATQSAPAPTPPPATIDYSQFSLVGSSGFSF